MAEQEVVHRCPPAGQDGEPGSPRFPCCGQWVQEMILAPGHRMTIDPDRVTCGKEKRD